ncbi:MAG: cytochrome-c peroxidase [Bacteroidetes bacterium]|nr:cytochrome-c peroxidase [Bacteroidota bacterium]
MRLPRFTLIYIFIFFLIWSSCSKDKDESLTISYPAVQETFGANINLSELQNYAAQSRPGYIMKDNSGANPITDAKATLGRVLFYDKNLSINNTISCASCHQQQFAFSDPLIASKGVEGETTGRHSMRLINTRFGNELKFFWNERAASLEHQTTQPIQDHAEMGFSGQNGRPGLSILLGKLQNINYYKELFQFVYMDQQVTESRLQECLAQFVRSIQSFDSRFDTARMQAPNDGAHFQKFSSLENQGKQLFLQPPNFNGNGQRISGGAGCAGCHRPPEFDIDPNSRNNGIVGSISGNLKDLGNTRSPSLRDLTNNSGTVNSPMMHHGGNTTLRSVILHYNNIIRDPENNNLDPRLTPGGVVQQLQLTDTEIDALITFLQTLSGNKVYTDKKWSDPFLK